jgi:hypothetical protein
MKYILCAIACAVIFANGQTMVVRVYAPSWEDLRAISSKGCFDVASARAGEYYDVIVDQQMLARIIASGVPYEVRINSLELQKDQVRESYLSYAQIRDSLRSLSVMYPSICKFDSFPIPSYQGNWQYYVKISDNPHVEEDDEPGYLIEGTHHSREWACPITVMFFVDSILEAYGSVSQITDLVNNNEFYCAPAAICGGRTVSRSMAVLVQIQTAIIRDVHRSLKEIGVLLIKAEHVMSLRIFVFAVHMRIPGMKRVL